MHATNGEIKEWLNKQVEANKVINEILILEDHENDIDDTLKNLSRRQDIQLAAEALRYVANRLGLTLFVARRDVDTDDTYEIAFMYNGVLFMALETEEEYDTRGPIV